MKPSGWPTWLKEFIVQYRRDVVFALALGLLASGCAALLMFTAGYLISATAIVGTTLFSIMVPVACVQLFGIGRPFARYFERLVSHNWVLRITSVLRVILFRSVDSRTGDPSKARATGEYLGLLADDVAHLQNLYLRVVFPSIVAYLLAVATSLLFGFFSPAFAGIVVFALVVTVVVLPYCTLLATRAQTASTKQHKGDEYVQITDDINGSLDWVLSGRADEALKRHALADDKIRSDEFKVRLVQRAFTLAAMLVLLCLLCCVIAWAQGRFGGPESSHAALAASSVNWIAAFALGFFPLVESFTLLPAAFSELTTHHSATIRLDECIGGDVFAAAGAPNGNTSGAIPASSPKTEGTDFDGPAIELTQVSYTYPGASRPALRDLSLSFAQGQTIAVLGRSGSGKSTFADLVRAALSPDFGEVKLFGSSRGPESWRLVGYLGQTPYLFNRTLRENLTLGVQSASDDELKQALIDVGLGEKYSTLPDGLDTVIGETGQGFSGGEAHRIALSRALVAHTPIVIVDEPFSALDYETAEDLLDTLIEVCADCTLVVITHHLNGINRFNRVIFIENGQIDLDGSPDDLMVQSERFRDLVAFDHNTRSSSMR